MYREPLIDEECARKVARQRMCGVRKGGSESGREGERGKGMT